MASRPNNNKAFRSETPSTSSSLSDDDSEGYKTPEAEDTLDSRYQPSSDGSPWPYLPSDIVQQVKELSMNDGATVPQEQAALVAYPRESPEYISTATQTESEGKLLRQRSESDRLRTQLNNALAENRQLKLEKQEAAELKEKLIKLEQENGRLRGKISNDNSRDRTRLEGAMQEKAKLEVKCQDIMRILEQIEEENECLATKLKAKGENVQQLGTDLTTKNKQLVKKLHELDSLQKECKQLKDDCDKLEKEKNVIKTELNKMCEEVADKDVELKIAEDWHFEVCTQVHELQDQNTKVKQELHEVASERNDLSVKVIELEPAVAKLSTDNQKLTTELEYTKQQNAELIETVSKLTALSSQHNDSTVKEKKEAKTRLEEVEAQRDNFLVQRDNFRRNLGIRNEETIALQGQISQLQKRYEIETKRLREQNAQLQERHNVEATNLKEQLNAANREILQYRFELDSYPEQGEYREQANHQPPPPHYEPGGNYYQRH